MTDLERLATHYGVSALLLRRAQLADDVRHRLEALERRADGLRAVHLVAREAVEELRVERGRLLDRIQERVNDARYGREAKHEAAPLVAILDAEIARGTAAFAETAARAQDALRVVE